MKLGRCRLVSLTRFYAADDVIFLHYCLSCVPSLTGFTSFGYWYIVVPEACSLSGFSHVELHLPSGVLLRKSLKIKSPRRQLRILKSVGVHQNRNPVRDGSAASLTKSLQQTPSNMTRKCSLYHPPPPLFTLLHLLPYSSRTRQTAQHPGSEDYDSVREENVVLNEFQQIDSDACDQWSGRWFQTGYSTTWGKCGLSVKFIIMSFKTIIKSG